MTTLIQALLDHYARETDRLFCEQRSLLKLHPIARDAASAPGARSRPTPGDAGLPEDTRGDRSQPA